MYLIGCRGSRKFYGGEIAAVAILHQLCKGTMQCEIMRTNSEAVLAKCSVLVGTGGKYDPETWKYDHTAKNVPRRPVQNVPYGQAGLIWKHHGLQFIKKMIIDRDIEKLAPSLHIIADNDFIMPSIDLPDLDREELENDPSSMNMLRKNKAFELTLYNTLYSFNPPYYLAEKKDVHLAFARAVQTFQEVFINWLYMAYGRLKAKVATEHAYNMKVREKLPYLLILLNPVPWQHTLLEYLNDKDVQFVISREQKIWKVHAVPTTYPANKEYRILFPQEWRKLSGQALSALTNFPSCRFCNEDGTMAGADTYFSARALAEKAMELAKYESEQFKEIIAAPCAGTVDSEVYLAIQKEGVVEEFAETADNKVKEALDIDTSLTLGEVMEQAEKAFEEGQKLKEMSDEEAIAKEELATKVIADAQNMVCDTAT